MCRGKENPQPKPRPKLELGSLTTASPEKKEDGKEMKLDTEKLGIKGIVEEVDRHSRALQKQADLTE